jgi:hypothetical protein
MSCRSSTSFIADKPNPVRADGGGLVKRRPTGQHVRVPQQTHLPDAWAQARALRDRGDLASARMLLEDSLDVATFQYGEDHPDILATAHLLATLHRRGGDLPAARRVLEEALQAGSLRHDEAEPIMLKLSFELAGVAEQVGNRQEARRHYGRVATHGPAVPGFEDRVREAVAWLGPQAAAPQPAGPAPGVVAVPPSQPPSTTLPATAVSTAQETPAIQATAGTLQHAPLPALSGPLRFPAQPVPSVADEPPPAPPAPTPAAPPQIFTSAPSVIVERRGRGTMVAAVAAALVAVIAAGVVVVLLLGRGGAPGGPMGQRTGQLERQAAHAPAGELSLGDHGDSITLRWTDPAAGQAGFAVKMGPSRETVKLVTGNLGSKPAFTITGLNAKYTYCFSVVTIYSATELLDSDPVCTARAGAGSG